MSGAAYPMPDPPPLALTPPPAEIWAWWRAALKGSFGPFDPLAPQQGIYRFRPRKSDRGQPARLWFDNEAEQWLAEIEGQDIEDVAGVWRYCHQNPISKALYDAVLTGGNWPDELPEPEPAIGGMGHNSRCPEEEVRDEIESADAAFTAWFKNEAKGAITNEEQDAKVEAYTKRFLGFKKRIEEAHKTAKAPLLEQTRVIDAAWITGPDSVKAYAEACQKRVAATAAQYRIERKQRIDEAARLSREAEANRRRLEAERKAKADEEGRTFVPSAAPPKTSYAPKKATGLTERKFGVVDDLPKVAAAIAGMQAPRADFVDLCRKIAEAILKAGGQVDGAHLETEFVPR